MDSFERDILVRQLGLAIDEVTALYAGEQLDVMPACAWFWGRELEAWTAKQHAEPQSDLYTVTAAAEKLGFDVADVYYDPDDPTAIVIESFSRRRRKPQPPV